MCTNWYYQYARCGHIVFQQRQRCNDYLFYGSCSIHHHEEYVYKWSFCPPCHHYGRRDITATGTDKK